MQEESASGGSRSGCGARAGFEDRGHRSGTELAAADFEHGSNQVADHVVEKSVAANAVNEQIP